MREIPDPDRRVDVLTVIVLSLVGILFILLLGGFVAWMITRKTGVGV